MEEKVWGEKTLSMGKDKDVLNKMGVRFLVNIVQDNVERFLSEYLSEKAEDIQVSGVVKKRIDNYLQHLEKKGCIQKGKSYTHVCKKTWKELYPRLSKRIMARIGYFFIKQFHCFGVEENKPHIWQHIFPYKVRLYVDTHNEKLMMDWHKFKNPSDQENKDTWDAAEDLWDFKDLDLVWYENWLEDNPPTAIYKAVLKVPYTYLNVELFIQPIKALEKIEINFSIERE